MARHGGNLAELARRANRPAEDILDFSASINPLGPPECLRPVVSRALDAIIHYPDPDATGLVEAIASRFAVLPEQIILGNGSTEILFALVRALAQRTQSPAQEPPGQLFSIAERALIPVPSYSDYPAAVRAAGLPVETISLREDCGFALDFAALAASIGSDDLVMLGQPNNPTGLAFDPDEFRRLAAAHPAATLVVDEAFADFVPGYATLARNIPPNVIVLHSLTKFYAIPGLRLGFAAAPEPLAARIRRQIPNWSVNHLAQAVGVAVLADEDYARRTLAAVTEQRESLVAGLARLGGLRVYPSQTNFVLVRVDRDGLDAHALADRLLADGIAIRIFDPADHLDHRYFRVAVRTADENQRLLDSLAVALGSGESPSPCPLPEGEGELRKRGPAANRPATIMFQGTSSNAGKSILAAALCRILLQDGLRVAPFKSQNMSLNSFVTRDGGEMGRAQVVQAQACRIEPDVRMNPILLKPNSDTGCQVIVRGQPVGNMRVGEYIRYKPQAFEAAKQCYDSLAADYDAIVLEGAGSPGEVNLKGHDIVNMRMAQYARSPVLVVGDIDRGGVFASFVGTIKVLAHWERQFVRGWIVNRFRGDASLLTDALDYTLRHTGRPVLGVVPFIPNLNLPQEDSVEFKSPSRHASSRTSKLAFSQSSENPGLDTDKAFVEIAVIDLPHISNFTDFDAFGVEPDVRVRIVRSAGQLNHPDAIIIPGSKNTLGDLAYLKSSGVAARIAKLAAEGRTAIIGICGGFQMLGRLIRDPHGIESNMGPAQGLGLLAVETVLAEEKTLVRTTASHLESHLEVAGYEIHHGRTSAGSDGQSVTPLFARTNGDDLLGAAGRDGRVWGTYLHGIFDADPFRRWFLDRLRAARSLPPLGPTTGCYDIEPALDRLAAVVRRGLNMDEIYRLMGLR